MRVYLKQNVFDAALERVERIFREFPNVIVGISGGKDSTAVLEVALIVARKLGRLPLKVLFIDQEAEWQATIDMVQDVMERPEVEPLWFQIPIVMSNATSTTEHWLMAWDPKEEHRWMRPKWPRALTKNVYGTPRFGELFSAIVATMFPDTKTAYLAGLRAEESPGRATGITSSLKYKDIAWGKILDRKREHYTFYPLYDWSYTDIWAAIHKHGWKYNRHYDTLYRYGSNIKNMRVSNLHHETAIAQLFWLQECEPATYARLTQRISGTDMAGKMGVANYFPKELPAMFSSWLEYRDHLLEKLVDNEDWKKRFKALFDAQDEYHQYFGNSLVRVHIATILTNDWELSKINNFAAAPGNLNRIPGKYKLPIKRLAIGYNRKVHKDFHDSNQSDIDDSEGI
jgi:predicted phosphoadenosine phosphosulfate sulfurtransferase